MSWTKQEPKKIKSHRDLESRECSSVKNKNMRISSRVLIIDADKLIRWSIKEIFIQDGFEVDTFASVEEALRDEVRNPYDLIIADFEVDKETGIHTINRISRTHPSTPLILLSSDTKGQIDLLLPSLNIFSVVEKPFRIEQIRAISIKALASSHERKGGEILRDKREKQQKRLDGNLLLGEQDEKN